MSRQFYVYELIDPRSERVFYVGKGQRRRINQHEIEARRGKHSRKCEQIRDIWSSGGSVLKRKVFLTTDEIQAYTFEAEHIERIGLSNLTNIIPGGVWTFLSTDHREVNWAVDLGRRHIHTIARCIRIIDKGMIMWLGDMDITPIVKKLIARMIAKLGHDEMNRLLSRFEITVTP